MIAVDIDRIAAQTWHKMIGKAMRMGSREPEAVANYALFKLWRRSQSGAGFPDEAHMYAYLWIAVSNLVIDERRGMQRYRNDAPMEWAAHVPAHEAVSAASHLRIDAIVQELPPVQQQAIQHVIDGWTAQEIANELQYDVRIVYDAIRAARKRLRRLCPDLAAGRSLRPRKPPGDERTHEIGK